MLQLMNKDVIKIDTTKLIQEMIQKEGILNDYSLEEMAQLKNKYMAHFLENNGDADKLMKDTTFNQLVAHENYLKDLHNQK